MSAGLSAKNGKGADARSLIVAKEFGVSLDDHHATLLTQQLVDDSDLVFVMDFVNEAKLLLKHPEAKSKVFLLPGVPGIKSMEVVDPYEGNTNDIRHCYEDLVSRLRSLAEWLHSNTEAAK